MTTTSRTQTPVSLYGFVTPRPGRADALRRVLSDLVEPSRSHAGNLQYHLHEQDDGRFFLYEVWASQEDLDRHHATALVQEFVAQVPELVEGAIDAHTGRMLSQHP
ncbi:putative quinol monooxygenase [Streptomyces sp. 4N509B]|uniref:putative quinol monooxygenase n=1 Tax=Streptomyces sp. 4N509B TaxID=3457413 RepID=UPI003FCF5A65